MSRHELDRRRFLQRAAAGVGAMSALAGRGAGLDADSALPVGRRPYRGPNVVMIRFGGGVRRRETIEAGTTYSPYFLHELCKRGTLYKDMEISNLEGVQTSHGQGTLYLLTGKYNAYRDVNTQFLGERFESEVPTVFEYFRKEYDIPDHQALIINGEDRTDEEFYSFSNHHLFGVEYRSNVLSLYRYKVFLLRKQIERADMPEKELAEKKKQLAKLEALDIRVADPEAQSPEINRFWEDWRTFYGESGFVNPRGDRLLTELTVRALKQLRPKLLIVNFNDPDYVHWGNPMHYTIGISVIDEGIKRIVEAVEADEEYRGNTVFAIVPDCGRDTNRMMDVPFQHHFGSRSSHEIFGLFFGAGIARGQVVDRTVDQISVAATISHAMNVAADHTEGPVLSEAIA